MLPSSLLQRFVQSLSCESSGGRASGSTSRRQQRQGQAAAAAARDDLQQPARSLSLSDSPWPLHFNSEIEQFVWSAKRAIFKTLPGRKGLVAQVFRSLNERILGPLITVVIFTRAELILFRADAITHGASLSEQSL